MLRITTLSPSLTSFHPPEITSSFTTLVRRSLLAGSHTSHLPLSLSSHSSPLSLSHSPAKPLSLTSLPFSPTPTTATTRRRRLSPTFSFLISVSVSPLPSPLSLSHYPGKTPFLAPLIDNHVPFHRSRHFSLEAAIYISVNPSLSPSLTSVSFSFAGKRKAFSHLPHWSTTTSLFAGAATSRRKPLLTSPSTPLSLPFPHLYLFLIRRQKKKKKPHLRRSPLTATPSSNLDQQANK